MGANFGIIPPLDTQIRDKKERYAALAARSLEWYKTLKTEVENLKEEIIERNNKKKIGKKQKIHYQKMVQYKEEYAI